MVLSDTKVSVIGTGAVGGALVELFDKNKITLCSAWSSAEGVIRSKGGRHHSVQRSLPESDAESGSLVFIAVPDDQIALVASQLAESPIRWKDKRVVHCSGALFSDILKPVADKGAAIASMHPIQTFRRGDGGEQWRDIFISLEGDPALLEELKQLVHLAQAHAFIVDKPQKRALHLAAVLASNYLVTLQYTAEEFLSDMGIQGGFRLVEPLVRQTVDNISSKGTRGALSGPIERKDLDTVKKHLDLIRGNPGLLKLYAHLGLKTCELAGKENQSDSESSGSNEIKKLFLHYLDHQ